MFKTGLAAFSNGGMRLFERWMKGGRFTAPSRCGAALFSLRREEEVTYRIGEYSGGFLSYILPHIFNINVIDILLQPRENIVVFLLNSSINFEFCVLLLILHFMVI